MPRVTPHLYVWHGRTLFFGYLPNIEEHAHHALQIEIGLFGPFVIVQSGKRRVARLAIIPPDVPHHIDDRGQAQAIIYLDPQSTIARTLQKRFCDDGLATMPDTGLLGALMDALQTFSQKIQDCSNANRILQAVLSAMAGDELPDNPLDTRIERVLALCRQSPHKKISAKELAHKAGLSEGRLSHLFKAQVGVPIRRYLLWTRLSEALMALARGGNFTDAAHHAGFADAAHLSRTYRRMYGNSLYDLTRKSQFVQAIPCFLE